MTIKSNALMSSYSIKKGNTKMKFVGTLLLALAVSGCGGGGGGGGGNESGGSSAPIPLASVSVAAFVAAPTYPILGADPRLAIFNEINAYRSKLVMGSSAGVGMLAQDTTLDFAAQKHADYLAFSQSSPIETHDEVSTSSSYYYAATPHDRALKAGFIPANAWIGESIGDVSICARQLLNTVYHLQALTGGFEKIGIGYTPDWTCVIKGALVTGVSGMGATTTWNGSPIGGGQQIGLKDIAVSPYSGEANVAVAMSIGENPRPVPTLSNPGHPVMLRVKVDFVTDALHVKNFKVMDSTGSVIAGVILVSTNASSGSTATVTADGNIMPGVVFFVPQSPLSSGKTYTAQFDGDRNGSAVALTWSFSTKP